MKAYTVNAEAFSRYLRRKAAISAAEKRLKMEAKELGLPVADDFNAPTSGVIQDGNGSPVAKFSVFQHPGATIPPGLRVRIS